MQGIDRWRRQGIEPSRDAEDSRDQGMVQTYQAGSSAAAVREAAEVRPALAVTASARAARATEESPESKG